MLFYIKTKGRHVERGIKSIKKKCICLLKCLAVEKIRGDYITSRKFIMHSIYNSIPKILSNERSLASNDTDNRAEKGSLENKKISPGPV